MIHVNVYSPSVANVMTAFQRERSYWSVLGDRPPKEDVFNDERFHLVLATDAPPDARTQRDVQFHNLVETWKAQRGSRSSITEAAQLLAYQSIIGMGPDAVPLLLAQLRSEGDDPDQWFWALRAITGANPVPPADRGNYRKMAQAWFKWADENNAW